MFEFARLHLENVSLYDGLDFDLSGGPDRDTILIRGHNNHGKTSLFRALTWAVFGKEALNTMEPGLARFALRLLTAEGEQTHHATLEFTSPNGRYRIRRTAVTTDDAHVVKETVRADRHDPASSGDPWREDDELQGDLKEFYFPPELAPYLFLNADKVKSVVSSAVEQGSSVQDEITAAINLMLGITAVEKTKDRVHDKAGEIRRKRNRMVGDTGKTKTLSEAAEKAEEALDDEQGRRKEIEGAITVTKDTLEAKNGELRQLEHEEDESAVYQARADAQRDLDQAAGAVRDAAKAVRLGFGGPELILPLFTEQLATVSDRLGGMHEDGVIPQSELPLIKKLLRPEKNPEQLCICNETDISEGTDARGALDKLVNKSQKFEKDANRLDKVNEDLAQLLDNYYVEAGWWDTFRTKQNDLKSMREELTEAQKRLDAAKHRVAEHEQDETKAKVRSLREEVKNLEIQLNNRQQKFNVCTAKIKGGIDTHGIDHGQGLESQLSAAKRALSRHMDSVADAKPLNYAVDAADVVKDVLDRIVDGIHHTQVPAVSDEVNQIFMDITNSGHSLSLMEDDTPGTAIASGKVGIRERTNPGTFELFAETVGGIAKPIGGLNGASRQALTVSFMVALLNHSGAPIPMVSDSLFHNLSGNVKFQLAKHLLSPAVQTIIFFTHDDVGTVNVRKLLTSQAARTYTVSNSTRGNDLANPPRPGSGIAMVCRCGPEERCATCHLADLESGSPTADLQPIEEDRVL